jgi:hypothetical protein
MLYLTEVVSSGTKGEGKSFLHRENKYKEENSGTNPTPHSTSSKEVNDRQN